MNGSCGRTRLSGPAPIRGDCPRFCRLSRQFVMQIVSPLPRSARERLNLNLSRESGREPAPGRLTRGSMVRSTEGEGDRVGT
jgi:hypothetical protein